MHRSCAFFAFYYIATRFSLLHGAKPGKEDEISQNVMCLPQKSIVNVKYCKKDPVRPIEHCLRHLLSSFEKNPCMHILVICKSVRKNRSRLWKFSATIYIKLWMFCCIQELHMSLNFKMRPKLNWFVKPNTLFKSLICPILVRPKVSATISTRFCLAQMTCKWRF